MRDSNIAGFIYMAVYELSVMSELDVAVGAAVESAQKAYDSGDKNPFDHGFAHLEVDGRTSLAKALQEHPAVNASDSSYVTVDGLSRYLTPQQAGYRAFIETLEDYGVDVGHVSRHGRLD